MMLIQWLLVMFLASGLPAVKADEHNHVYKQGDDVIVWANTVGPRANRQETYEYYQLPFCVGQKLHDHRHETLGEALQGMQLVNSGLEIHFKQDAQNQTVCRDPQRLNSKQINLFRYAVSNNYYFQMFLDELPIGGYVGVIGPASAKDAAIQDQLHLYTHMQFDIGYNNHQIIEVNLTMGSPLYLNWELPELPVEFTYSVKWIPTDFPFEQRFEKYLDSEFFEHKIHWFSILNSFMMVIFLTFVVSFILIRTLRRDFARYDTEGHLGDLDRDLGDDYGWKQVHGDVFRTPNHLSWLCAMVGTGYQLAIVAGLVVLYTIIGDLYEERASILTVSIFLYALSSIIAGYFSGSLYSQHGGKKWIRTMFLTAGVWPGATALVTSIVNSVAIYYSSSKAIPFGTIVAVMCIWMFLIFPLTLLGSILGRNWAGHGHFPLRVNPIPRPIPEKQWYTEPMIITLLGGLLPFGSIFIEMYFVFTSFWAYKIYYVYGFMLLVMVILWIVTACVSIVACYYLLNAEDHRWHWISFFTGGSISVYIYLYSIYYFIVRTKMYGLFQTTFYFGYTAVICFGLFMMCGSIGYLSASLFVRRIYSTVKID